MPVFELGEGVLHICGRMVARLLVDFLFEMVCYGVGFVFLRLVTFGKYPPGHEEMFFDGFVSLLGGLLLLGFVFWFIF